MDTGEPEAPPSRHLYELPPEAEGHTAAADVDTEKEVPELEPLDAGPPPPMPALHPGDRLRAEALHLQGSPITQLSTSRLLAYVSNSGAHPRGIEWIDDTRCVVVFDSYDSARDGFRCMHRVPEEVTYPSYQDIEETPQDAYPPEMLEVLLRPRLSAQFPRKLFTTVEEEAASTLPAALARLDEARQRVAQQDDTVPEIYRDMELQDVEAQTLTREQSRLQELRKPLWVRFALLDYDTKAPRSAQRSNWYREHGRGAGKDVVTRLLHVGDVAPKRERRSRRAPRSYDDAPRSGRMYGWDDEEYAPPPSLLDRIGQARGHAWDDEQGDDAEWGERVPPPREHSASPELRIRGRGARRA